MATTTESKTATPDSCTARFGGVRAGVVYWEKQQGALIVGIAHALRYLGCDVVPFAYDTKLPPNLDVLFVCGPFGSLAPLIMQLVATPVTQRPSLVFILTEQLPNPGLPEWLRSGSSLVRSRLEQIVYRQDGDTWRLRSRLGRLTLKGQRYRYYGDLRCLRRHGLLSVLAIPSQWTADFLRARGFAPVVLPPSVNQGEDLKLERDIPVLWLGKPGSARRARLLQHLRDELRARGVELLLIDGVENPYVFGENRTALLNRTKIMVNILREKWDDNSLRYVLAAPCKALVVTEPTLPHSVFEPGVHIVEAPLDKMADTICYYLQHEEERQKIVEQAYELIGRQSGLGKMIQLLEQALATRPSVRQAKLVR